MLIELYMFFEAFIIGLFVISFYTKQEIMWALTLLLSGFLSFMSYSIEKTAYSFNSTSNAYDITTVTYSYPYLTGINIGFFVLAMIFLIYDLWTKYGPNAK